MNTYQKTTTRKTVSEQIIIKTDKENINILYNKVKTYKKEVVQRGDYVSVKATNNRDALSSLPPNSAIDYYASNLLPNSIKAITSARATSAAKQCTAIDTVLKPSSTVKKASAQPISSSCRTGSVAKSSSSSIAKSVCTTKQASSLRLSPILKTASAPRPISIITAKSASKPSSIITATSASKPSSTSGKLSINRHTFNADQLVCTTKQVSSLRLSPILKTASAPRPISIITAKSASKPSSIITATSASKPSSTSGKLSINRHISNAELASLVKASSNNAGVSLVRQTSITGQSSTSRPSDTSKPHLASSLASIETTNSSCISGLISTGSKEGTSYKSIQSLISKPSLRRQSLVDSHKSSTNDYHIDTVNSKQITYRNRNNNDNEDEVFVDGKDHYINYYPSSKMTKRNTPVTEFSSSTKYLSFPKNQKNSHSANGIVKAQKTNLVRKLSQRSRLNSSNYFNVYIYNTEYMTDYYKYMLHNEWMLLLKKNVLVNNKVNINRRMANVDWLVSVQDALNLNETALLSAIRVFDYILASTSVNENSYTLIAIVALWICNKYYGHKSITVSKITTLCNGNYTKRQITKMEMFVLSSINFRLNIQEPSAFLCYYLKLFGNDRTNFVQYACCYIFECVALTSDYSFTAPSLLACSAFFLILSMTNTSTTSFLNYISHHYDENTIKQYSKQLCKHIQQVHDKSFPYKNVLEKYKKLNVTLFFQ